MSLLPEIRSTESLTPREMRRATQEQGRTEMQVYRHFLAARARTEIERIDSDSLTEVLRASLDAEIELYEHGLRLANGSQVVLELLARKMEIASGTNNRRIEHRFGA